MSIKAKPTFSLKDQLFNAESVALLASALQQAHSTFKRRTFEKEVLAQFPVLELKQRIDHMVSVLEQLLPSDFTEAVEVLHRALPAPLDPTKTDDDFGQFIWVVPGEYVAKWGCNEENLERSLEFLRESTKRFSAEGAIRPFLNAFPIQTMEFIRQCARDGNYHVRRLASEGIRPLLPWAERVRLPIEQVTAVLTTLHQDPTRYVTRSVANNLNDISKIEPAAVIHLLQSWQQLKKQKPKELDWMIRHSLRTLSKTDHAPTLALLGFTAEPRFRVSGPLISESVKLGDDLVWSATLHSLSDQRLKLALKVHYQKANGAHSGKVFALKELDLNKNQSVDLQKKISFKAATTRTLYPGTHYVELLVNGVASKKMAFDFNGE